MKEDGTIYLALILIGTNYRWELLHWGYPAIPPPELYGKQTWCNQVGLGMKFDTIIQFIELDSIIGSDDVHKA